MDTSKTISRQDGDHARLDRILILINYSDSRRQAMSFSLCMAQKTGVAVKLVHVFCSIAFDLIKLAGLKTAQEQLRAAVANKIMGQKQQVLHSCLEWNRSRKEWARFDEVELLYDLLPGTPKHKRLQLSNTYKPDLVVMGA
jgi:hypothetical protein